MEERQVLKMNKEKLKIKFLTYDVPALTEDDTEELTKFVVLLAQQGFKDNIVKGKFPRKAKND